MIEQFSVTQVLSPYFNVKGAIPKARIEGGVVRGNEVHKFSTSTAKKEWYPKPILYEGYCDSFLWWFDNCVEEVFLVEKRLEDPILGFFGHPDLIVRIKGYYRPSIVDLKTPASKQRAWRMQIAAYHHLAIKNGYGPDLDPGGSLRLNEDGRPPHLDRYDFLYGDFAAFLSALNVYRFLNG
jgi:hypothetical protein